MLLYPSLRKEAIELMDEGHGVIPLHWVETDKNAAIRAPGKTYEDVPPKWKSRLVAGGHLENNKDELRSDSPTCDLEGQFMIMSFASSQKRLVKSVDITNAYFQGTEQDRLMLLKQPKGGLPGENPENYFIARVPIYGTVDAGRKFWKKLRTKLEEKGLRENAIMPALYSMTNDEGQVTLMVGTHVDDILWVDTPETEHIMNEIIQEFQCGEPEHGDFDTVARKLSRTNTLTSKSHVKLLHLSLNP